MNLQEYIDQEKITKYRLSQISGIPKTTIMDICSGKSSIQKCSAKTVQQLAEALGRPMEFIMTLDETTSEYDSKTGLPKRKDYLECGLPTYLRKSLDAMIETWKVLDGGGDDLHKDLNWCELNADINCAEVDREISSEQAWYLREKYLRMERED